MVMTDASLFKLVMTSMLARLDWLFVKLDVLSQMTSYEVRAKLFFSQFSSSN